MKWLRDVDDVLRGRATNEDALTRGTDHLSVASNIISVIVFAAVFGAFLGLFAVVNHDSPNWQQVGAAAAKMPLVFLLTLVVTFPSLYVFSALLGTRLRIGGLLRLVLVSMAVSAVVVASLGPISGFFTLTTNSYPFLKLLNGAFAAGGLFVGLGLFVQILKRLELIESARAEGIKAAASPAPFASPNAGDPSLPASASPAEERVRHEFHERLERHRAARGEGGEEAKSPWGFFRLWVLLYACVWAQMVWIMRPFMGQSDMEFAWFRARESNVFMEMLRAVGDLFGS